MNKKELVEFYQLLIASLEGTISDQQRASLMLQLREDPEAMQYYTDFLAIYTNLCCPSLTDSIFKEESQSETPLHSEHIGYDADIWKVLLETEKTAPTVEFPKNNIQQTADIIDTPKAPRKINKFSLYTLVISLAAMLLLVVFVKFTPSPVDQPQEVATLTDAVDAVWEDSLLNSVAGFRFSTHSGPVRLLKGVAKIAYDKGIDIMVEGPAELEFISPSECSLNYGKLYARVSSRGIGFTVATSNSRVVDLGTEFGILKNTDGATEVHVIKGKTSLQSGSSRQDKMSQIVLEGHAKQVRPDTSQAVDIEIKAKEFVRDISSQNNIVWRGESLRLASMVSGGNGLTIGDFQSGIDPATGKINPKTVQGHNRQGEGYHSVRDRYFVDGVFIPNGSKGANVVSSAGHTFDAFPETDSFYWSDITSSPYIIETNKGLSEIAKFPLEFGSGITPMDSIIVHANAAITFDLDKIRHAFPQIEISAFKAFCGVSQNAPKKTESEFWVLLDGQNVYHSKATEMTTGVAKIEIVIQPQQRFLTLATTAGGDKIPYDWCFFADPVLVFSPQ